MQNLCRLGRYALAGSRWNDPTDYRLKLADTGTPVGQMCGISTFCEVTTVSADSADSADSAVKVSDDIPLEKACLVGCGVVTGWGSEYSFFVVIVNDALVVISAAGNTSSPAVACGSSRSTSEPDWSPQLPTHGHVVDRGQAAAYRRTAESRLREVADRAVEELPVLAADVQALWGRHRHRHP
jgi:hypothetical protein